MPIAPVLLLAFGAMLCWGLGDFLMQRSSRRVGSLESLTIIAVVGGVLVTPFVLKDLHLLANPLSLLLLVCLGAITFTATSRVVPRCVARYTLPIPPAPS